MSEKEILMLSFKYQLLGNIVAEKMKTIEDVDTLVTESIDLCNKIVERVSNESL